MQALFESKTADTAYPKAVHAAHSQPSCSSIFDFTQSPGIFHTANPLIEKPVPITTSILLQHMLKIGYRCLASELSCAEQPRRELHRPSLSSSIHNM